MTTTAAAAPKASTDVAKRVDANVQALRERNQMVAQIRGTQWGLGIDSRTARAVAHYCLELGLDPVRHVEVLGGRIYLTAEFYLERGAPFIRSGEIIPHEPEFINVDPRLEALAQDTDAETATWAKAEKLRRTKARIEHNAPEAAVSTCVLRLTIAATNKTLVGVNWCGGGTRKKLKSGGVLVDGDPIGDLEPTKTSITRAGRRAWKQVADVIMDYGKQVKPVEARAELINEDLAEGEIPEAGTGEARPLLLGMSTETVTEVIRDRRAPAPAATDPEIPSARMLALLEAERLGHPMNDDELEDLRQWHEDHPARAAAPASDG
jgi:hypothetical protein